jgi:hypothetical protein
MILLKSQNHFIFSKIKSQIRDLFQKKMTFNNYFEKK